MDVPTKTYPTIPLSGDSELVRQYGTFKSPDPNKKLIKTPTANHKDR